MENLTEKKELINELAKNAHNGQIEIIYREGKAAEILPPVEPLQPKPLKLIGAIGTIAEFLKKRHTHHCRDNSQILVSVEDGEMVLVCNAEQKNNEYPVIVFSKIIETPDFKELTVNDNEYYEPLELARYLRTRKHLFFDADQFRTVFAALSSFKAEISKRIEKADDRSGNATMLIKQEVVHNMPKSFVLKLEPFKNSEPVMIEIEIDVNPNDLKCTLMSFELRKKLTDLKTKMISKELETIIDSDKLAVSDWCIVIYS